MSLLHQDKTGASNGVLDPMQFQHQQLLSQFQRNVSNNFINTFVKEKKKKEKENKEMRGMEHYSNTLCF